MHGCQIYPLTWFLSLHLRIQVLIDKHRPFPILNSQLPSLKTLFSCLDRTYHVHVVLPVYCSSLYGAQLNLDWFQCTQPMNIMLNLLFRLHCVLLHFTKIPAASRLGSAPLIIYTYMGFPTSVTSGIFISATIHRSIYRHVWSHRRHLSLINHLPPCVISLPPLLAMVDLALGATSVTPFRRCLSVTHRTAGTKRRQWARTS